MKDGDTDDVPVVRSFLRGAMRLHVLHHAAQSPVSGTWMAAGLAEHGYRISPGTLYPALHQLQDQGLLASHEEVINGRTVRLYEATTAGRAALERLRLALGELAGEVLE
jgi:DNA-binding PadR family transcriptional regulator